MKKEKIIKIGVPIGTIFLLVVFTNVGSLVAAAAGIFAFAYFTAQAAKFGDTILAANAILIQFIPKCL